MDIDNIKEGVALIRSGMDKLARGPLDYYLLNLAACYELLLTLAPFQPGDRVRLTKTPEISNTVSWGWLRAKHFMKAGTVARVMDVSCDGRKFSYSLRFEEDSWLDSHGVIHPHAESERGTYCLTAEWFEKAD
jgi:hypothetical protein